MILIIILSIEITAFFIFDTRMISLTEKKIVKSLHRKKGRNEHGLFIIEGLRAVSDVANSSLEMQKVFITPEFEANRQFIPEIGTYELIGEKDMEEISTRKTPPGVLAVVKIPKTELNDPGQDKIILIDGLSDPGNMGAIIRSAYWFGFDSLFCSGDTVDLYNPKVVQATMGSIANVNVHYVELCGFIDRLKNQYSIAGLTMEGKDIREQELDKRKIALVIGSESDGISGEVMEKLDLRLKIQAADNKNKPESLNASVAASVAMFRLQWGWKL